MVEIMEMNLRERGKKRYLITIAKSTPNLHSPKSPRLILVSPAPRLLGLSQLQRDVSFLSRCGILTTIFRLRAIE
jgi:hypothetical protein